MAQFPVSIITYAQTQFHKTNNLGSSTISATIGSGDTTITVSSASLITVWPNDSFVVKIADELVFVGTRTGTSLGNCVRGFGGTTAVGHTIGDAIITVAATELFEAMRAEIIAIETELGTNAARNYIKSISNVGSGQDLFKSTTAAGVAQFYKIVAGTNVSFDTTTTADSIIIDVSSPGGAPTGAQYLTLANDSALTNERAFVAGDGLDSTDAGADSTFTVFVDETFNFGWSGLHTFGAATVFNSEVQINDFLQISEQAAPSTPASGYGRVYPKTDGKLYYLNDGATEYDLTAGAGSSSGIVWTEVTGTTQALVANNGYVTNNAALVTLTLPVTANVGEVFLVSGSGSGGWRMAQNASQQIIWRSGGVDGTDETTTGTGGRLDSTDRYDYVQVQCIIANTTFKVIESKGNISLT